MKLWEIKTSAGVISALPTAEFFDSDSSIVSVALEPSRGLYLAAGNEEGKLCVWNTKQLCTIAVLSVSLQSLLGRLVSYVRLTICIIL